jgi:hypothetical protein
VSNHFPRPSVYPTISFFQSPVTKDVALAPTPGTLSAAAAAEYGRVGTSEKRHVFRAHLHHEVDGSTGSTTMEMYRRRGGVVTLIANVTLAAGSGDFTTVPWTFTSDAVRFLEAGDYLHVQATSKMGGSPVAFIDVHWDRLVRFF